jgi:2-polyprenyl-3-methyl-5-hydroxy-6-metoxy-1,4-benzoquinol methylase
MSDRPANLDQAFPIPEEFQWNGARAILEEKVDNCPVCGSSSFHFFASGYDYELQTCLNLWTFVQCDTCRHVWLNPRPAVAELSKIYPKSYYAYNYAKKINPIAVQAKMWMDRGKMKKIVGALDRKPRSFLDIGCGNGRFLKVMEAFGVEKNQNYGLELDERVIAPLRSEGYQAYCERVEDCDKIPTDFIDLITMFHVIEHVENPSAVVAQAVKWLAPGGIFAVETPNLTSLDAKLFHDTYWGGYHIPRHWNLFTEVTLSRLLLDNGLEPVAKLYQTGHSFWMYSLHHALRFGRQRTPNMAKIFDPFTGFLPFLAFFTAFDKIRAALGFKTSALLVLARKK